MIIFTAAKNQLYAIALQKLNVCNFMYIYLYDSKFTNEYFCSYCSVWKFFKCWKMNAKKPAVSKRERERKKM